MTTPPFPTIAESARTTRSTTTCARLLALAGLDGLLGGDGKYTLFAPSNQAFDDLPPGKLRSLEDSPAELRAVLEYHILAVGRELSELHNGKLRTISGELLTAQVTDDGVSLDHANTRGVPLRCANGAIHEIDAVLFPGFTPELSETARADSAWSGRPPASTS